MTATFIEVLPEQYTLTTSVVGGGLVSIVPDQPQYASGAVVQVEAVADAGWEFSGWSGDLSGSANPASITMDGDKTVTATFVEPTSLSAGDVIISGLQSWNNPNGQNPGEFVELFNTTDQPISLETMALISRADNNADGVVDVDWQLSADLSGKSIAPHSFFLIAESGVSAPSDVHDVDVDMDLATGEGGSAERAIGLELVIDGVHMDYVLYGRHDGSIPAGEIPEGDIAFDGTTWPRSEVIRNTMGTSSYQEGLLRRESAADLYAGYNVAGFYTDENTLGDGYPNGVWTSPHDELYGSYEARNSLSPAVLPPSLQYSLTANVVGDGLVSIVPDQPQYASGAVVQVEAVADAGWEFSGWSGDLSGSVNPASITMDGDKTVTATFIEVLPEQYTLTVNVVGNGSVTLLPDAGVYDAGTPVQVEAVADAGWEFSGWSGDLTGSANPALITMDADKTVTATFIEVLPEQYTLTTSVVGGGLVSIVPDQPQYASGAPVQVEAVADAGWQFSGWSGDLTGAANPALVTMDADKTVTATFIEVLPEQYTLTTSVVGGGLVSIVPDQPQYASGTVVQVEAVADAGWEFSGWSGDLSGLANPASITMDGDKTVTATFVEPTSLSAGDVIISGLQSWNNPNGQNPGEFVELFNTTDQPISLETMALISRADNNADGVVDVDWQLSADLSGKSIAPHSFFLIAESGVSAPSDVHDVDVDMDLATGEGGSAERAIGLELVIDGVHMDYVLYGRHDGSIPAGEIPEGDIAFDGTTWPRSEVIRNTMGTSSYQEGLLRRESAADLYAGYNVAGFYTDENTLGDGYPNGVWTSPHDELYGSYEARNSLSPAVLPPSLQYSLTANVVGDGLVSIVPDQPQYASGAVVQVEAVADAGWEFSGWSGDLSGSANPASITMDGDKTVTATFVESTGLSAGDVIISSLQSWNNPNGQNPGEFVELFNTTDQPISLETMALISRADNNADGVVDVDWQLSADLSGKSIAPHSFFLIAESGVSAPSDVHDVDVDMDLATGEGGSAERAIGLELVIDGVHMDYVLYGRHDGSIPAGEIPEGDIAFDGTTWPRSEVIRNTMGTSSYQEGLLRRESAADLYAGYNVAGFYTDENTLGDGYPNGVWTSPHDELYGSYEARNSLSPAVLPPSLQ